jgi:CHAT domain-containing protein
MLALARRVRLSLALVMGLGLAGPVLAQEAPSRAELKKDLKLFWDNFEKAPGDAAMALWKAEKSAVKLWLPADDKTLADVAFAMTFWWNRDKTPWLDDTFKSPSLMYETAKRIRDPGSRSILLRRAWYIWSYRGKGIWATPESMQVAYDTATNLVSLGRRDEARAVVEKALKASAGESLSTYEQLGLRYLEAKLLLAAGRLQEAAQRLEGIYETARGKAERPPRTEYVAWQVLTAQELIDVYTRSCDPAGLAKALRQAVQSDAGFLLGAHVGLNDDLLRSMLADLPAEARLFAPLLRCGGEAPEIARSTLERFLIQREGWRFRRTILRAAAASKNDFVKSTLRSLTDTRKVQAQLQLRRHDAALRQELVGLPIPENLSPPEGVDPITRAWMELSAAAATLESNVVEEVQSQWKQENVGVLTDLVAKAAEALSPDAVLLVYLELPDVGKQPGGTLVFVVDRNRNVVWKRLAPESVSPDALLAAASSLAPRGTRLLNAQAGPARWREPLREMGKRLIDPIESLLGDKKKFFLLTGGRLRLLPWQAFIDREGRFLCDRASIRYVQSASELFPPAAETAPADPRAVLVGPVYDPVQPENLQVPLASRSISTQFEPLSAVGDEIDDVRDILAGAGIGVRVLGGPEATERALWSLRSPRLLHFAGHGFRVPPDAIGFEVEASAIGSQNFRWPFESRNMLGGARYRTGIALSDANAGGRMGGTDGLLTAAEAADLDLLGTDLVVLSACETGYPVDEDRTGAYDLALAFRLAGARSVVASLWRVADRATAIFMAHFYRALVAGKSVVAAVQSARDEVRATPGLSDPFFWAGFEAFGEDVLLLSSRRLRRSALCPRSPGARPALAGIVTTTCEASD